jgi:hypothetical protein
MMNAGEVNIKEGIWMIRMEYFVLEEKMKGYECGWSKYSKHSERGARPSRHGTTGYILLQMVSTCRSTYSVRATATTGWS